MTTSPSHVDAGVDQELRERALARLEKRRDLGGHVLVYVLVNTFVVAVWLTTSRGVFWPAFPIALWGIGLVVNAWDAYRGDTFDEATVQREMERLRGGRRPAS